MAFLLRLFRYRTLGARALRVSTLAAVLLGVTLFFAFRRARASAAEALGAVGEQLMQLPQGKYGNAVQPISVNGVQLMFQSAHADIPYNQVIQQFEEACLKKGGLQEAEFGKTELQALQSAGRLSNSHPVPADGVFVHEGPRGTVVACIDTQGVPWLSGEMLERVKKFRETGDLHEIGVFRYALVKKTDYGAHFLTLWSGNSTPLLKMFPKQGDAPGADHAFVPRVAGSRRVLSSTANTYQMVAYEHPDRELNDVISEQEAAFKSDNIAYREMSSGLDTVRYWVAREHDQAFVVVQRRKTRVVSTVVDVPK
jgi:hypothetical protein